MDELATVVDGMVVSFVDVQAVARVDTIDVPLADRGVESTGLVMLTAGLKGERVRSLLHPGGGA